MSSEHTVYDRQWKHMWVKPAGKCQVLFFLFLYFAVESSTQTQHDLFVSAIYFRSSIKIMLIECQAFSNRIGRNCDSFRLNLHNGQWFSGKLGNVVVDSKSNAKVSKPEKNALL